MSAHQPTRVAGCGTGLLLRHLATRLPQTDELVGLDPAPGMVQAAVRTVNDPRLRFIVGVAEKLPFPDAWFDLVVSTTSFDHWKDQRLGLVECARVLEGSGRLVLSDLFSVWLLPTLVIGRRGRARTRTRAGVLLKQAGFRTVTWHGLYTPVISAAIASK